MLPSVCHAQSEMYSILVVYRGCADQNNLPWAVNSHVQCQYQGDSKSLWWFCEGDLCNEVSVFSEAVNRSTSGMYTSCLYVFEGREHNIYIELTSSNVGSAR